MKQFDRQHATLVAATLRTALDEGRWVPDRWLEGSFQRFERTVSAAAETDEPDLEIMRVGMIEVLASDLRVHVQGAYLDGSYARPTQMDVALFAPGRQHLAEVVEMPRPVAEIVDMSFLRRPAPAALAA